MGALLGGVRGRQWAATMRQRQKVLGVSPDNGGLLGLGVSQFLPLVLDRQLGEPWRLRPRERVPGGTLRVGQGTGLFIRTSSLEIQLASRITRGQRSELVRLYGS